MAQVANKENMVISIREYQDNQGQTKKVWKTIGELITWDDGSKSFELWGAGGLVKGNIFEKKDDNNQQQNNNQQSGQQQRPMNQAIQQNTQQQNNGGFQNNQQQGGFNNN